MARRAFFVTVVASVAFCVGVLRRLPFLTPYLGPVLHVYGWRIAGFVLCLAVNVFALALVAMRWARLDATQRKHDHIDREFRGRHGQFDGDVVSPFEDEN